MTKGPDHKLFLLRHAKSSWSDPDLADHDRPLAARGLKAAGALEEHLRQSGIAPDLALSSSAVRAVQTLEIVRPALPSKMPVKVEPDLYGTNAEAILARLRELPSDLHSVLLVNHSPAIEMLAVGLCRETADPAFLRMRLKYPTAGFATLSFNERWSDLSWGSARFESFVAPRDLE